MSITKRVTYLRGMVEGLELERETKEQKVLHGIIEILDAIAVELEDLDADVMALDDDVSVLVEDMQDLEDTVFEPEEPDCCCPSPPSSHHHHSKPQFYTVQCPSCDNEITIDEDVLNMGVIDCPSCGEKLELDAEE